MAEQEQTTSRTSGVARREKRDASAGRKGSQKRSRSAEEGLEASEVVDDALSRGTEATVAFIKRYFGVLQWVIVGGLVLAVGWHIYGYRRERTLRDASDVLGRALTTASARVGDVSRRNADSASGLADTQLSFESEEAHFKALAAAYEAGLLETRSAGIKVLSQMGLAGVRFRQGKFEQALKLYGEVKESPQAALDPDLKGRATAGIGFSREGQGDLAGAIRAFRELESQGALGFPALGLYQQARLHVRLGEPDKAKPLLEQALKKIEADAEKVPAAATADVEQQARALLALLDPTQAEPANRMTPEQLRRLQELLKSQAGGMPEMPIDFPLSPGSPEGAGEPPAPDAPEPGLSP